jgi:hypothetical protein
MVGFYPYIRTNNPVHSKKSFELCYRALMDSYNCNLIMIEHPEEFLNLLSSLPYISIEEKSKDTEPLASFEHPEEAVYFFGNIKYGRPSYWFNNVVAKVHIPTPVHDAPLYGFQAASIVLNDRYIKNGTTI